MGRTCLFTFLLLRVLQVLVAATPTQHGHRDGHTLDSVQVSPHGMLEHTAASMKDQDMELIDASHAENAGAPLLRSETYGFTSAHPDQEAWEDITQEWVINAISRSVAFASFAPVLISWASRLTGTMRTPLPMSLAVVGIGTISYLACDWSEKDMDTFAKKVVGGSFLGAIVAFLILSFISGVMCLGMCMDSVIPRRQKIGMLICFVSFLTMYVPEGAAIMACRTIDDEICASCVKLGNPPCDEPTRQLIRAGCQSISMMVAYILAFGWLTYLLAQVAFGMACCMIFGCCTCKLGEEIQKREKANPTGHPVRS